MALPCESSSLNQTADLLDKLAQHIIEIAPWEAYDYIPRVRFSIAHDNKRLLIKFDVHENALQAKYRNINDPVYRDSCVEFFIAFDNDEHYYNFEFNCLGTCRAGYGKGRDNRKLLPSAKLALIDSFSIIAPFDHDRININWQLTLAIPLTVFSKHEFSQYSGLKGKANFFKCGDELPQPHFLSWSNIVAEEPNFHLPEFFGQVHFE